LEDDRLSAERIFWASAWSIGQFGFDDASSSEPEEPALSAGVTSDELLLCTMLRALGWGTLFISISRSGELSESEEKLRDEAETGGAPSGEPSDRFDRKPVLNLLFRAFVSVDASGGVGIGEDELRFAGSENIGGGGIESTEETSGVVSRAFGVAW
jgi:hypothetical protein